MPWFKQVGRKNEGAREKIIIKYWFAAKLRHMFLPCWACTRLPGIYRPSPHSEDDGETPLDIARRSGACAEIIGLLSLTPRKLTTPSCFSLFE